MNIAASRDWSRAPKQRGLRNRILIGVLAGFLAILANTAMLITADQVGIVTARGGLLTLLLMLISPLSKPIATTWLFKQCFHVGVGMAMAAVYAILIGDMRLRPLSKGISAAAVVWMANACVLLPSIGQGFAGSRVLTATGMLVFAAAHTAFFVVTALLYDRWTRRD